MRDFHRILLSSEIRELADDVARLFQDLDRGRTGEALLPPGQCVPTLDVVETEANVEVVVDLPGVPADRVRVLFKNAVLIVAGEKPSPYGAGRIDASFHLVERSFGRFARGVQINGAVDAGRARGAIRDGELRVVLPRITDRRGQGVLVPVAAE